MTIPRHHRERGNVAGLALTLVALVSVGMGCQRRTAMAAPPVVIVPATPENSSPKPVPPEIKSTSAANEQPILPVTTPPPAPANKRHSRKKSSVPAASSPDTTTTAATAPAPQPPAPPQISPQVTPGQQAAIEQKVREQIAGTEENLRKVQGRQLTAGQRDIAEKVRSFLTQAGEEVKASNWTLASNLADKAHVLSEDLLRSF
jgi:hypothetical protein